MQPTTCGCKKLKMPRALILNSVSEFPRRTSQANDSRHISSSERGLIGTYDARAQQDPRHIVRSFGDGDAALVIIGFAIKVPLSRRKASSAMTTTLQPAFATLIAALRQTMPPFSFL